MVPFFADFLSAFCFSIASSAVIARKTKLIIEKNPELSALPLYYQGENGAADYPAEESYAIAVNKDRPELLDAFNSVLAEMLIEDENGKTTIDKLVLKYMGLSEGQNE